MYSTAVFKIRLHWTRSSSLGNPFRGTVSSIKAANCLGVVVTKKTGWCNGRWTFGDATNRSAKYTRIIYLYFSFLSELSEKVKNASDLSQCSCVLHQRFFSSPEVMIIYSICCPIYTHHLCRDSADSSVKITFALVILCNHKHMQKRSELVLLVLSRAVTAAWGTTEIVNSATSYVIDFHRFFHVSTRRPAVQSIMETRRNHRSRYYCWCLYLLEYRISSSRSVPAGLLLIHFMVYI